MPFAGGSLFVDQLSRLRIQGHEVTIFPAKINQSIVDHRGGDIGCVAG